MKKGILVVSFGTSYEETLKKNIEAIENKIKDAFAPMEVRRAFTSNMIIAKLKREQNLHIDRPMEALNRMIEEGYTEIYVQTLHVIPGYEYEKVKHAVIKARHKKGVQVHLGLPLLNHIEHYHEVVDAFAPYFEEENDTRAYVLMGHGTEHFANAAYSLLQRIFDEKRSDIFIANVEGYPELEHIVDSVVSEYKEVVLMPLMMVAGDHAINDMASDEEDSFKSVFESHGVKATPVLMGMGENPKIQDLFVQRVQALLNGEEA